MATHRVRSFELNAWQMPKRGEFLDIPEWLVPWVGDDSWVDPDLGSMHIPLGDGSMLVASPGNWFIQDAEASSATPRVVHDRLFRDLCAPIE